jgi:hypothetical protein
MGGPHPLLNGLDVIGNAPEFHYLMLQICDGKRGPRITIARLSNRTWIQEIALRRFDTKCGKGFRGSRSNLQHLEICISI